MELGTKEVPEESRALNIILKSDFHEAKTFKVKLPRQTVANNRINGLLNYEVFQTQ
ncbi:Hypothetical predicted protein [Marmota monax]|uniref:Uncharacterized protein n=1 Tax=Marmota monax TaxID=9995 RepID=A0A5E4ASK0_MARMO|nr:hypothetical protein GHT09_008269 [Marmota monax]VTJ59701.1 Hypothetical predicted protein [Marmota monax]